MVLLVLNILGALALFIYGMKVMSDAVQRMAGSGLRKALRAVASNRFGAWTTGFFATSLIQSSSAVTVMVVSLVNAGMLAFNEAAFLIMGSNVGTTMTAWLISLLGLGQFSLSTIALPFVGVGLVLLFVNKEQLRTLGESVIGFGLLFLGLELLKEGIPRLDESFPLIGLMQEFGGPTETYFESLFSSLLFIAVGVVFTMILQSSSVTTAFTLLLISQEWIGLPSGMALILGENIGTTMTANLAAVVANVHGKRVARFHLLFNLIGSVWMFFLLPFLAPLITNFAENVNSDLANERTIFTLSLAAFHTLFNLLNVLLFLSMDLVRHSMNWLTKLLPSKVEGDDIYTLEFLSARLMGTSELSIVEAQQELVRFGKQVNKAYSYLPRILLEADARAQRQFLQQIERIERITDKMEVEIADYLSQISSTEISPRASEQIRAILAASNYLERSCDLILKIGLFMLRSKKEKAYFTPELRQSLVSFMSLLQEALDLMNANLAGNQKDIDEEAVVLKEKEVDGQFKQLHRNYLQLMERKKLKIQSGLYYHELINELERLGDHVQSVSLELIFGRERRNTND